MILCLKLMAKSPARSGRGEYRWLFWTDLLSKHEKSKMFGIELQYGIAGDIH